MGRVSTKTLIRKCLNCGIDFYIPRCRRDQIFSCSSKCKKEYRAKKLEEKRETRKRSCLNCGVIFFPMQWQINVGNGKYCSHKCASPETSRLAHTEEANKKRVASIKIAVKEGRMTYPSGPSHHQWTGGLKAAQKRRNESGKRNDYTKKYRRLNPHKTREFVQNRRNRKFGRLPIGFIAELLLKQKGKCAICKISLKDKYHVDHIYPISKGGMHEPKNIQILCATCNVRKSAKDPIKFMQENGWLL